MICRDGSQDRVKHQIFVSRKTKEFIQHNGNSKSLERLLNKIITKFDNDGHAFEKACLMLNDDFVLKVAELKKEFKEWWN